MTDYSPDWNLQSIPDKQFYSESGRRRAAKGYSKPKKTEPCSGCGLLLGVAERRGKCPSCGASQPRQATVRRKKRRRARPQPR